MDLDNKSDASSSATKAPAQGVYQRAGPLDLRSPCPMINAMANHGYIPRNGRNVYRKDLYSAVRQVGLSSVLASLLSNPIYLERKDESSSRAFAQKSLISKVWYYITNPWAIALSKIGMRMHGQTDARGTPILNLDQFALHDAVEHDISLSRRDHYQGDNNSPQEDLIEKLLNASTDGGNYLTMADLAKLRGQRIETQKLDNKELNYGGLQHEIGCGEIALLLKVMGDGEKVPRSYLKALFAEERLPIEEGWKPRSWWTVGLVEVKLTTNKVKSLIGMKF